MDRIQTKMAANENGTSVMDTTKKKKFYFNIYLVEATEQQPT